MVRFDSPSDGADFHASATIDIALDVSDPEDLISRIDLFGASQKLASFTEAPYIYSWKEVGPGTYSITAKIVMTDGTTRSENVGITVEEGDGPGNQSPVVNAGEDQSIRLPENTVSFTAMASHPDGAIANCLWEQLSGPAAAMSGTDSPTLSVEELEEGSYTFKVLVTDNEGATASDEVQLFVEGDNSGNQVPVVSAGSDKTLTLPTNSISLSGTGKDSDGRFVAFLWEKVSGPSVSMSGQNTANVKLITDLVEGIYVFRFSGTDNEGATGTDEMTLTVKGSATALVAANVQATTYPNTFQNFVHLRIEAEVAEVYRIDVYDLQGKVYHRSRFVPDLQGNQAHRIDLSDATIGKGMYILRVENESGTFRKLIRIIKNL